MENLPPSNHLLLVLGSLILVFVMIGVVLPNVLPTSRGILNRQRRELKYRLYRLRQAVKAAESAAERLAKLRRNAQHVEPRKLEEAEARAKDLQILAGHAHDKVLVAENHLRRIILERYPPARQQKMLSKFAPQRDEKALPFTF